MLVGYDVPRIYPLGIGNGVLCSLPQFWWTITN